LHKCAGDFVWVSLFFFIFLFGLCHPGMTCCHTACGARRTFEAPTFHRSHRVVLLFSPHISSCQAGRVLPKPYIAGVYSMAYYTPGKLLSSSTHVSFFLALHSSISFCFSLDLLLSLPR
jgi:hypothetical protein